MIAQLVKNRLQCRRPQFDSSVRKIRWRRDRLPTPVFLGFPCGSAGKESASNVGLGLIPGLGSFPGKRKGYPLQYSGLENAMDCLVHWVTKSQTQLSDFHITSQHTNLYAQFSRDYCIAHETLLNVMWQPGWKGSLAAGREGNGYIYTYS